MRNDAGEEFGLKRLAEVVRIHHEKSADEIVKAVSAGLAEFIGRVRPHDDRTLIAIKMGTSENQPQQETKTGSDPIL